MKDKIVIVGSGANTALIHSALQDVDKNDVVIVDRESDLSTPLSVEPFIITNPYPIEPISVYSNEKKFICKGRHQYREVKETVNNITTVNWVCQCGRVLE